MGKKVKLTESNLIKIIKRLVAEEKEEQRPEQQRIGKHWFVPDNVEPLTDEQVQKLNVIVDGWDKELSEKFKALHSMLHASKEWKEFISMEDELGEVIRNLDDSSGPSAESEGNPEYDNILFMIAEEYLQSIEDDLHDNLFYPSYPGGSDWY